jgi:hypothetical protein
MAQFLEAMQPIYETLQAGGVSVLQALRKFSSVNSQSRLRVGVRWGARVETERREWERRSVGLAREQGYHTWDLFQGE